MKSRKLWLGIGVVAIAGVLALGYQRLGVVAAKDSPFNGERAFAHLKEMVEFGPRPAGSPALETTRKYIVSELEKLGYKPVLDEFTAQTPKGPVRMANIRVVKPGAKSDIIIISGHYDTKIFDFRFVGASDGASSAAWLIEMAAALKNVKFNNTIEFIFFDGEEAVLEWTDEDSVYGSRYDVERRTKAGTLKQLKGMILVDMIGDKNLNVRQESSSSRLLRGLIWETAHSIGYAREFPNDAIAVSDDHIPYLKAGIHAVDLIDFDYPYWHTAEDTLDKTSAQSLKIVGDVIFAAMPRIDERLSRLN